MDELLIRKLSRQLKILNAFIVLFTLLFVVMLTVVGIGGYVAYREVKRAETSLNNAEDKVNNTTSEVQDQFCNVTGAVGQALKQKYKCN